MRGALADYEWIEDEEIVDKALYSGVNSAFTNVYEVDECTVLRPETTVATFRAMVGRTPPVRLITAGRVFRNDEEDSTHQKVFHQFEALCVEPEANPDAMKATVTNLMVGVFGPVELRWEKAEFYSVEQGLSALMEHGGEWVDVAGCGMVNDLTLSDAGFDPRAVSGYALGLGLERVAMLKYGIDDIRKLWSPPYVPE